MLIDDVVSFCDTQYRLLKGQNCCPNCNHIEKCSGSCKQCLEEIHFPTDERFIEKGRKEYNCPNLLNFYVCDYSFKYASEILYLLRRCVSLNNLGEYNIMSIGCGGCPDLMAFESFLNEQNIARHINYVGIDMNKYWQPIHSRIVAYDSDVINSVDYSYDDATVYFGNRIPCNSNVLILQYIISYLYCNNPRTLNAFFDLIIDNFIIHKRDGEPFVILVNDVNSNKMGRDYFQILSRELTRRGLAISVSKFHFTFPQITQWQHYGTMHQVNNVLYEVPRDFERYEPWRYCSSAQMIIEIN